MPRNYPGREKSGLYFPIKIKNFGGDAVNRSVKNSLVCSTCVSKLIKPFKGLPVLFGSQAAVPAEELNLEKWIAIAWN